MNIAEYRSELSFQQGFQQGLQLGLEKIALLPHTARVGMLSKNKTIRSLATATNKALARGDKKQLLANLDKAIAAPSTSPIAKSYSKLLKASGSLGGLQGEARRYALSKNPNFTRAV